MTSITWSPVACGAVLRCAVSKPFTQAACWEFTRTTTNQAGTKIPASGSEGCVRFGPISRRRPSRRWDTNRSGSTAPGRGSPPIDVQRSAGPLIAVTPTTSGEGGRIRTVTGRSAGSVGAGPRIVSRAPGGSLLHNGQYEAAHLVWCRRRNGGCRTSRLRASSIRSSVSVWATGLTRDRCAAARSGSVRPGARRPRGPRLLPAPPRRTARSTRSWPRSRGSGVPRPPRCIA
jgi:hypothetical protein